jgi:Spy/CpxP family protein refolding chaperone
VDQRARISPLQFSLHHHFQFHFFISSSHFNSFLRAIQFIRGSGGEHFPCNLLLTRSVYRFRQPAIRLTGNNMDNTMTIKPWMKWTVVAAVACGLTATVLVQKARAEFPRHGRLLEKLASLGISDEQRDQIHAILREAKPKAEPLVKQFVTERRALRKLVLNGASEAEIRAQVAKVAKAGGDLAVLKSQTAPKIREVLTPEQREKVNEMISEFDDRVDSFIEHLGERIGQE